MARVRPFRAYTYHTSESDISRFTAPPYDVISEEQRADLIAKDPNNVVTLELPDGPLDPKTPGNRYETGARTWGKFIDEGILEKAADETLYALEQRFSSGGNDHVRRAFIVEVGLEPFDAGVVLPHERTLPKALGDRYNLIEATAANLSQVFGLFPDEERVTDSIFEKAMTGPPAYYATDEEGVESRIWTVADPELSSRLTTIMADKQIFIADGHHRYTTALAYRDARREADAAIGAKPEDPDHDWLMMALVNMDDPDLVVLPTHRVADAEGDFDASAFWASLGEFFDITDADDGAFHGLLDSQTRSAFLVRTRADERPRLAVLRENVDLDTTIAAEHSSAWKQLDVAVLLELILDPLLGIHPDRPETLDRLSFVKDAHQALEAIETRDVAFVLRATKMEQMREGSIAGDVMPQKSTYFYPKLLSGLVLRGMD